VINRAGGIEMKMLEYITKEKEIKGTEIAELLGLPPQTISKWNKGIKPIPKKHLKILANKLNVPEELLLEDVSAELIEAFGMKKSSAEMKLIINDASKLKKQVNVALQPGSDKSSIRNFENTILNTVPYAVLEKHLTSDQVNEIKEIYSGEEPQVWGCKNGETGSTKRQYEKLSKGDLVLFYRDWKFIAKTEVTFLLNNKELATQLWGRTDFENIYFVSSYENINIPVETINMAVYPKNSTLLEDYRYPLMGFKVLNASQSEAVLDILNVDVGSHLKNYSKNEYEKAIKLDLEGQLDRSSNGTSRVEQGYLRKILFGKSVFAKCACCGEKLPTSMLWTAHIKKRSMCSYEEKINTRIVMPMCKFGCDTLFEDGFISVDSNGEFIDLKVPESRVTKKIKKYISEVVGNKCNYWDEETKMFFKWHYEFHQQQ